MSFPWFDLYPKEVNHDIDPDEFASVMDFANDCFKKYSDRTAYVNMDKTLTFQQVDTYSDHFAAFLQNDIGIKKGDRIAIQMPNLLQYPVVLFGAIKTGAIVVNTNPLYTPKEMKHQFNDAGVKAVIILANFASNLEKILPETSIEKVIITEIGDMLGGLKGAIVNFVVKSIKKMVPAYSIPNAIKFKAALKSGASKNYTKPEIAGSDVAFLQYTGGTTGVAKGAMLTNRNIMANMMQIAEWKKPKLNFDGEVIITALPLYHIFALTVNCLAMLKIGAKNILVTNPRDMPAFLKELKKYPFSIITGVNTLFNGLLRQDSFKDIDFSKLKVSVGGGMAVQKATAEEWKEVTGCTIVEGYGLTETCPVLSCNPVDGTERLGTIGIPLPSTEMSIRDDDGNPVPNGEPGEIWGRGPQVMAGYWERPEATAEVMAGEWLKTGDIAIAFDDGFFKIVDRKKEMINVSGFNVYPNEVEDCVASHPKVSEVGCIGVPDPHSNEVVKVFVVKKDPSLTKEELFAYCKNEMTGYKRPKHIDFKDELPKSNVGKILRRILKEEDMKNWDTQA